MQSKLCSERSQQGCTRHSKHGMGWHGDAEQHAGQQSCRQRQAANGFGACLPGCSGFGQSVAQQPLTATLAKVDHI